MVLQVFDQELDALGVEAVCDALNGGGGMQQVFDQELDALGVEAVCDALNGGGCGAAGV